MASGAGYSDGYLPLTEVFSNFLTRPNDLHLIMDYLYKILIDVRTANFLSSIDATRPPEHHPVGLASHIPRHRQLTVQDDIERTRHLLLERVSDDHRCSPAVVLAVKGLDLEGLWKYWSRKWCHTEHPWALWKRWSVFEEKEIDVVAGRDFILNCALLYLNLDPEFGDGQRIVLERLITAQPGYEDYTALQETGIRKELKSNFDGSFGHDQYPFFELNDRLERYTKYPYTLKSAPGSRPAPLTGESQDHSARRQKNKRDCKGDIRYIDPDGSRAVQSTSTPQMRANDNIFARSSNAEWDHVPIDYPNGPPWSDECNIAITSVIDQFVTIAQNVAEVFIRFPSPTLHQYRAAYRQTFDQLNAVMENPFSPVNSKVRKDLADDFCVKGAWDFLWHIAISIVRSRSWRKANRAKNRTGSLRWILFTVVLDAATGHPDYPAQDSSGFVDPDGVILRAVGRKFGRTVEQRQNWFNMNILTLPQTNLYLDHYDLFARHGFPYQSGKFAVDIEERFFRSDTGTMDNYDPLSDDDSGPDSPSPPSSNGAEDDYWPEDSGDSSSARPPPRAPPSSSDSDSNGHEGGAGRDPSTISMPVWSRQSQAVRFPRRLSPPPDIIAREDNGQRNAAASGGSYSRHKHINQGDRSYNPRKDDHDEDYNAQPPSPVPSTRRPSPRRNAKRRGKNVDDGDKPYRPNEGESDDEEGARVPPPLPNAPKGRGSPRKAKGKDEDDKPYRPGQSEEEDDGDIAPTQARAARRHRVSPKGKGKGEDGGEEPLPSDRNGDEDAKSPPRNSGQPVRRRKQNDDMPYIPSDPDTEDGFLSSDGLITAGEDDLNNTSLGQSGERADPTAKRQSETEGLSGFLSPDEMDVFNRLYPELASVPSVPALPRPGGNASKGKKRVTPPPDHGEEPSKKKSKKTPPSSPPKPTRTREEWRAIRESIEARQRRTARREALEKQKGKRFGHDAFFGED